MGGVLGGGEAPAPRTRRFLAVLAIRGAAILPALALAPPAPAADLRIEVNLPAYTLRLYDGAEVVMERPVTIGRRTHPTPVGRWQVDRLVWHPRWVPPPSARVREAGVRPPGPDNPMGEIKLPIAGAYYLHGTDRLGEIGKAASLGCIRLANPDARALGRYLQRRLVPDWRRREVARVRKRRPGEPVSVHFSRPVPIRVDYEPVVMEGEKRGVVHPDVYGRVEDRREHFKQVLARSLEVVPDTMSLRARGLMDRLQESWDRPLRFAMDIRPGDPERSEREP